MPTLGHLASRSLPKWELSPSDRLAFLSPLLWEHFDLLTSEHFWKCIEPGVVVFSNSSCSHLSL